MAKCNGCGYCCFTAVCVGGVMLLGKDAKTPCPLLVWLEADGRHYCKAACESKVFAERIYVGAGCCSSLNSWRKEVKCRV